MDRKHLIHFQGKNAVFKFLRRGEDGAYALTLYSDLPFSFFSNLRISSQELIKQLQYENDTLQSKIIAVEQTELQEVGESD